jgi:FkbM family methyltransferase
MSSQALGEGQEPSELRTVRPEKRIFEMLTTSTHFEHYRRNAYENYTADLVWNLLPAKALFVDVGAHHGFYTLLAATKSKNIRVISFEPVPENFEILKKNSELSKLSNAELHELALSNDDEVRELKITSVSSRSGFYGYPLSETIRTIRVPSVRLDAFFKGVPNIPTFVKIDTEGHEIAVLEGMRHVLDSLQDLRLVVEFNPDCLNKAGHEPIDLLKGLDQLGFDIYFIDDERREVYKIPDRNLTVWKEYFDGGNFNKNYFNVLCVRKDRSLDVCFFSHTSELGGAERSLLELVTELIENHGVICSVVVPGDGPLRRKLEGVGASTHILAYSWWCSSAPAPKEDVQRRLEQSFTNVLGAVRHKLNRLNPDIVFTNTMVIPWGAIAAQLLGKPHVWFVREFGVADHGFKFSQSLENTLDFVRETSNLILTNSNAVRKTLFSDGLTADVSTVYNHIEIPSDALSHDETKHFQNTDATKLVIVEALSESKGQLDAIMAVRELVRRGRTVELIVMGRASQEGYLERLTSIVKDENLQSFVRFVDFKENPYPVIDQADIVLVCSRNEAFGRITMEAMLLKKPVIGTRAGGTPELIRDGFNGLLYTPGDYIGLAAKIEYLIDHGLKIRQFGENGYKLAKKKFAKNGYGGRVYRLLTRLKRKPNPLTSTFTLFMKNLYQSLESENARLASESTDLRSRIAILQAHNTILSAEWKKTERQLDKTRKEIEDIRSSFGYRIMRLCASRIDGLCPDGTRRGRVRKRLVASLRALSE